MKLKCEHCNSENLGNRFIKSGRRKGNRFFRYCRDCNYNSYYNFPEYLDESQYVRYVQQATREEKN